MLKGNNLKTSYDKLEEISIKDLYETIVHPDDELETAVKRLRIIKQIDKKAYQRAKTDLPYVVCGSFSPSFRRTENFVSTDCFFVDVDNLNEKGLNLKQVRGSVEKDDRVALSFVSPGNDGLKLLFKLSGKCEDPNRFSAFYKEFVRSFSVQYGLEEVCDSKTCDVTRACFISSDPDAFFREDPVLVDMDAFNGVKEEYQPFDDSEDPFFGPEESDSVGPDDNDIERIKQILFKKRQVAAARQDVYVPVEVESIVEGLASMLSDNNVLLEEIIDIQYGKKFRMRCEGKSSEVNVFYGRRGFTVVPTPKRGTDKELNDLMAELIDYYLSDKANCA